MYMTSHNAAADSFKTRQTDCIKATYLLEVARKPRSKK